MGNKKGFSHHFPFPAHLCSAINVL